MSQELQISKEGYPDFTAQDPKSKYFDAKATPDNPRWIMVDIEPVMKLEKMIPLEDIKNNPECEGMALIRKGQDCLSNQLMKSTLLLC